jgi:proline iminopeptidase
MKNKLMFLWVLLCPLTKLNAQTHYTLKTSDGIDMHVNEYGAGKPVILLAGGPGMNAEYLDPIRETIANYRFIIPDQRGSGRSVMEVADSTHLTVARYVEDLELLRKHLKIEKLIIAGHSWGGMLGMAYAAQYPTQVDRLILIGSGGVTGNFNTYFESNINMRLHDEDIADAKAAKTVIDQLRAIAPGYFFDRKKGLSFKNMITETTANANIQEILFHASKDYTASGLRGEKLRRFDRPVYIIQGRQDPIGESTVYETKTYLPQAKISFIERCGHFPWFESKAAADEFYKILSESLSN